MSSPDDLPDRTGLGRFLVDGDEVAPRPPKVIAPFAPVIPVGQQIIAFDQTLAHTGWVVLTSHIVLAAGVIVPPPVEVKGPPLSIDRGVVLHREMKALIGRWKPVRVVCEMPPVMGHKMHRPESSLMAALSAAVAADEMCLPLTLVPAQKAKVRFGGDKDAKKMKVREGIFGAAPFTRDVKPMNEHISDALALALLFMESDQ